MTDTQLDPEMELEAQQLANYEDELRELSAEVQAQDEYFEEHKEEMFEGQKRLDEMWVNEECNRLWIALKKYSLDNFRQSVIFKKPEEDDDWCTIINQFEYGSIYTNLKIHINEYSDDTWSFLVDLSKEWFYYTVSKHWFDDYQQAIDGLNSIAPFIYDLQAWNIQ